MNVIRTLRADEIECRVGMINERGLSLLLFKDARVDQKILDETFGPMGWKRSHQMIGGNLYCTVEVWDCGTGQWIAKQDVGTAGNSEAEKSQASDSFKRACFNWGIGRELYEAPFIWVPADKVKIEAHGQGRDVRYYTSERFQVKDIGYDESRTVVSLEIVNARGQTVYALRPAGAGEGEKTAPGNGAARTGGLTPYQRTAMDKELERTGVALSAVLERYGIQDMGQMSQQIYRNAMRDLKKSGSAKTAA